MTPREKVVAILEGREASEPALFCPGGMMSMATTDVMASCGAAWPEAHSDAEAMVTLALAMQEATGFDGVAMPFCMTLEAESYGARIEMGTLTVQPRPRGFPVDASEDFDLPRPDFTALRAGVFLEALAAARKARPDHLLVGNIVGPFSLLSMLADPLQVMRWTRRQAQRLKGYLDALTDDLAGFSRLQAAAGADVICISEPTATGEILGGEKFGRFVLGRLNRLLGCIEAAGAQGIVHICGDVARIDGELRKIEADAVSFDAMVDLPALVRSRPPWRVMGNVSAFKLAQGSPEEIEKISRRLLESGVDILAPACGIIPGTPAVNLAAMRRAVSVQ